jgi:hypothetical protein
MTNRSLRSVWRAQKLCGLSLDEPEPRHGRSVSLSLLCQGVRPPARLVGPPKTAAKSNRGADRYPAPRAPLAQWIEERFPRPKRVGVL